MSKVCICVTKLDVITEEGIKTTPYELEGFLGDVERESQDAKNCVQHGCQW